MRQLAFIAASVFVIWHTIAIVFVGPWKRDDAVIRTLKPIFAPYVQTFELTGTWRFYAPNPDLGMLIRYRVFTKDNEDGLQFKLIEDLDRTRPGFYRFTTVYLYTYEHEVLNISLGQYLCRRHADLQPTAIRFDFLYQQKLTPEQYRQGARPLDEEFLFREPGARVPCPERVPS